MNLPDVKSDGESWQYTWGDTGVAIGFELLREKSDGLHGELWVAGHMDGAAPEHIVWGTFNLSSPTTRARMGTSLANRRNGCLLKAETWIEYLEYACLMTAQDFRKGEPALDLSDVEPVLKLSYLMHPLIPDGQPTVLYGPGESSKGWLALAICMSLRLGGEVLPGLRPARQCNSLYLDWEADYNSNVRRQEYIRRGLGLNAKIPGIFYRKMFRPLADDLSKVRDLVDRTHADLVVIDSIGMAAAGDIRESDPAQRFMSALRALRVTPLLLGHVTKEQSNEGSRGRRRVIGSVFYELLARSLWEVRTDADTQPVELTLFNRKANLGQRQRNLSFRLTFEDDPTYRLSFSRSTLNASHYVAEGASLAERMRAALSRGKMTTSQLAEQLDSSPKAIGVTGDRLYAREGHGGIVKLLPEGGVSGRGHETVWALAAFAEGSSA